MSNTLLIFGAGPGISFATALRFGREGWRIVLAARDYEKTAELVTRLKQRDVEANALTVDCRSFSEIRRAITEVASSEHGLSVVLYNVGNTKPKTLSELTDEEIASNLLADVGGAIVVTQCAVDAFGNRGGSILLTGGGLALHPSPDYPMLSLAKAALRNFASGLFSPLQARNIRIAILTIASVVIPESKEAADVAEHYWRLAAQPVASASWEVVYP